MQIIILIRIILHCSALLGLLLRKQEYQRGGQRAPIREYQALFASIHANLMCLFASERDHNALHAATPPINLSGCALRRLEDATLQRHVIHVETADGAEYLFDAASNSDNHRDDQEDLEDLEEGEEEERQANLELWLTRMSEASSKPAHILMHLFSLV